MKLQINVIAMKTLLIVMMTHSATASCKLRNNINQMEITSTSDYMELNRKYVENVVWDVLYANHYPGRRIDYDGLLYYTDGQRLYVQQENSTSPTQVDGFISTTPRFISKIFLDTHFNLLYVVTNLGLFVLEYGAVKMNKIDVTVDFDVDFGITDGDGNVYVSSLGSYLKTTEKVFVIRKEDQRLEKISDIEQTFGKYELSSVTCPNKIAVDTRNNVYVGGFTGYIYLIEPGQYKAIKLKDIKSKGGVTSIVIDSKDNVYFRTNHALYMLRNGERKLIKIFELADEFAYVLWIGESDNVYFQYAAKTYALKSEAPAATEIDRISTSNGLVASNFTHIYNTLVKNNALYFITTYLGQKAIFAFTPTETSLRIVYTTDEDIVSFAITDSGNIYFVIQTIGIGSFVLRKNSKAPIEIRGVTGRIRHVFADNQNNIYFASTNGLHLLQDEEVTPVRIRELNAEIHNFAEDKSSNVYFGTYDNGAFVLRSGELEVTPIDGINKKYGNFAKVVADRNVDVIYFETSSAHYLLYGGETIVKTVLEGFSESILSCLTNCANNTYYAHNDNSSIMYVKYDDLEVTRTRVIDVEGGVYHMDSDSFNNLFFLNKGQLHMLELSQLKSKVIANIRAGSDFVSLYVDRNDNIYFWTRYGHGSDSVEVFLLRSGEDTARKIENISGKNMADSEEFFESGDDLFFVSEKSRLFLIRKNLPFESVFKNRNLGPVDNTNDETIFNTLNYLNLKENYLLNKSKNKIVNKTPTSATVTATNGKFRGSFNVTYSVKDKNVEKVGNFDLVDLLEKALFFDHVTKNRYNFLNKKDTQNISISSEYLKYFPVEVTADPEQLLSVEFKSICFNKKKVTNTSPLSQTIKIPECRYQTKETILFQVITGLNRADNKIEESVVSVLNSDDENVVLNSLSDKGSANEKSKFSLSSAFDLSNLNQHSHETGLNNFQDGEQEIVLPPKQRILVNYSVRTFVSETKLNLKQKIKGTIIATIGHAESYETVQVTIKEAMQTLKSFNLLPNEISINADNSITFNGRATLIVKRESDPKIIRNFYDI